jgi:hypothetical protein
MGEKTGRDVTVLFMLKCAQLYIVRSQGSPSLAIGAILPGNGFFEDILSGKFALAYLLEYVPFHE